MATQALRLRPKVKNVVWGGDWLLTALGRTPEAPGPVGESWEAWSGSELLNGPDAGATLGDLFAAGRRDLFGPTVDRYPRFPLLVKFIDARENLSVQVHPTDALAMELERYPFGKTEFWYIVAAEPGAEILYGLADRDLTTEALADAVAGNDAASVCSRVPVRAGDVVDIPAGTVHALTAGVVVYELQQDSDITYRLYDWGRVGREIHIEKGLACIDPARKGLRVGRPEPQGDGPLRRAPLPSSHVFGSELLEVAGAVDLAPAADGFALLSVVDGSGGLDGEPLAMGDTALLPPGHVAHLEPGPAGLRLVRGWAL
jgi:mannose-6-phosphate isomerase